MTAHSTDRSGREEDAATPVEGDGPPTREPPDDVRAQSRDGHRDDLEGDGHTRRGRLHRAARFVRRVLLDGIVLTGWVLGLTALFLATAWPRWAFYALLLGGIVGYVWATA